MELTAADPLSFISITTGIQIGNAFVKFKKIRREETRRRYRDAWVEARIHSSMDACVHTKIDGRIDEQG